MKAKKPTRLEKGILLGVVWLYQDAGQSSVAADMARSHGVDGLDVSDLAEFDREVFAKLNHWEGTKFVLTGKEADHA